MGKTFYSRLVLCATLLTFVVIVVGAFVRLTDAGLGCPDWPGCYGKLTPKHAAADIAKAVETQGGTHGPVSMQKAWNEMVHRYLAGVLGLLILAISILAWRAHIRREQSPWLPTALLGVVIFQAALGMWTVTMLLKPVIVMLHLLGGMATLALLIWLAARQWPWRDRRDAAAARLRPWAVLGLVLLVAQIALGGWVSTNYAALACIDLPTCHGEWLPKMDFKHGFQLVRKLGETAAGDKLSYDALTAIHWTHRVGAVIVTLYLAWLAAMALRVNALRTIALAVLGLLTLQVILGVSNILTGLKLSVAVGHNAGAALLLGALVVLNFALCARSRSTL
ncbi:MAG: heme A synthase [Betaproteobacteria bacterium]|nr:heme A synthase [Betaproteobacteria bacterium]